MKYRPEIDGLRALAVVPVILFHAGFELFNGGFVGVDVFFVISGYLITTILIEDIENKKFSIVGFYERRARRILPALVVMVVVSTVLGWFVLTPYFYRDLFQTVVAISFFASNVLLFIKSGYFSAISELKPFLHTWSLAVEEQYYIFLPVFLAFTWRFGKSIVFWMIVIMSLASLTLSEWSWRIDDRANFYLLHTRAWELFSGSIAAFLVKERGVKKNNILASLGLAAIIFSCFAYNESTPFPSIYTVIPVLGVVLVVMYAEKETLAAKMLSKKVFIGIGLISFSAYLWHQPIFALMRHLALSPLLTYHYIIAISIVLLISVLSWKFIEQPFRNKTIVSTKQVFVFSILVTSLMLLIGLIGHIKIGFPERLSYETNLISKGSFDKNPRQNECYYLEKLRGVENACIIGDTNNVNPTVAIIGNSHGDMFVHSLSESLRHKGISAYNLTFSSCSPVNFEGSSSFYTKNKCYELVSSFLAERKEITSVIVSFRWTRLITGTGFGVELINSNNELLPMDIISQRAGIVARSVEELANLEKHIVIIYPVPEAGEDVPNYITKKRMLSEADFTLRVPYEVFKKRNDITYNALHSITDIEKLSRIFPSKSLCKEETNGFCETVINGFSVYYDNNHLSNYGASVIMPDIVNTLAN